MGFLNFENAYLIGVVGAVIALLFAFIQSRKVMKFSEGNEKMQKIAASIRAGAGAYLKRQFKTVSIFFIVVTIILVVLAILGLATPFIPVAFFLGGLLSQLSAFIGMRIATAANARTANAASESLNKGLKVAFSSGTVLSFTVVGLALLDVSAWFLVLRFFFYDVLYALYNGNVAQGIAENMVMFGVGVAAFALFARVGGGIFTKAADVGADLVGKVEAGIPEDDPRNPAVIADNVGDNVGDVAGMGADLYESYIKSMHAAIALGFAAFGFRGAEYTTLMWAAMFLPVGLFVAGMLSSIIGTFFIRTKEGATQKDLLRTLRTGTYTAAALSTLAAWPITRFIIGGEYWFGFFISILVGVLVGCLIAYFTEYYTSAHYKPTKKLAEASETGAATIVIGGISLGMKSVVAPILIIVGGVVVSFLAASRTWDISAQIGSETFTLGLFGIGLSAIGMLSTLGITLACDAYGPVADNAGGIAEMAGLGEEVRERTDALDSIGNTTAATGKGFAIGSAALTSLGLVVSFVNIAARQVAERGGNLYENLSITNPSVLLGTFIGAMLIFVFSAMTMSAVQRAAMSIVHEVRRQFREITGLMEGTAEPDYKACVDLCTKSALREMVMPTVVGVVAPILTGLILGVEAVVGLIAGATVVGFVVAIFMANAGGAWDNAKKYIESGKHGGKGSDAHKAAVIGDTVGDPFKDTSGPSLNTLFKFLTTVAITFVAIIVHWSIFG